jgi:hypothetical protein
MSGVLSPWPFIAVIVSICTAIGIVQGIIFWRVQRRWFARHFGDAAVRVDILTRRVSTLSTAVEKLLHSPGEGGKNREQGSRSPHQGLARTQHSPDVGGEEADDADFITDADADEALQAARLRARQLSLHPADVAAVVDGAPDERELLIARAMREVAGR